MNQPKKKRKTLIASTFETRVHPLRSRITANEDRISIGNVIPRQSIDKEVEI